MTTKLTASNFQPGVLTAITGPRITNVQVTNSSYSVIDDTAVNVAGGYIKITGTNFVSGCQVMVDMTVVSTVTFVSATEVTAQLAAKPAGTYTVYVINPNGDTAVRIYGVTFSAAPGWITASSLTGQTGDPVSIQLSAIDASAYSLQAGSTLPAGLTLSSGGLISGTVTVGTNTLYNFTVVATDAELQESPRSFGITISVNAWNLSFASYNSDGKTGQFSVAAQETLPTGLFFKPDGTQMYVVGDTGNDINEYTLSAPWDVTTSTFVRSFLVTGQEGNPQSVFFKPDGTRMYVMGEAGDDINEYALSTAWNISTATYVQIFSIAAQETAPRGLYITDDGTKMYIVGQISDAVHEYSLGTAWNISTAAYVRGFSVGDQESVANGLFFKSDGTKMYMVGGSDNAINEYTLTIPWLIGSAVYVTAIPVNQLGLFPEAESTSLFFKPDGTEFYVLGQVQLKVVTFVMSTPWSIATARIKIPTKYFSVAAQDTSPSGVFFKPDGTRMYISGDTGNDINEYMLSTPWNINTADYNFIQTFSVAEQNTIVTDLFFKPDGTRMYVVGAGAVNEYTLGVAWSIVSSVYSATFSVNASNTYAETAIETVFFKSDGTEMYILGGAIDTVATFILSTPWSIATAKIKTPTKYFSMATDNTDTTGFFFKSDGTKLYTVGSAADEVNEYNLSTPWNISTATFVQVLSITAQDTDPQDVHFSPDGTRMYILGYIGVDVNEYSLSTAWNISTATFVRSFSVSVQEANPIGLFFKPDGTRMYVTGLAGDDVNEYSLSTAWNISTATYVRVFSISAQETNPYGLFFNPDGTRMYVTGFSGDDVNEYSLSTAWDVSTATYVQVFSVAAQTGSPEGVFFSDTGNRMYILSGVNNDIFEYDVSTPWNISTASYNPVGNFGRFSVNTQEGTPTGLFFRPNGTQMYVLGTTGDDVNEYTLSTPWDVTTATYVRVFSVAAQASAAQGIFFKPTGTSMYIVDSGNDAIYEYDII